MGKSVQDLFNQLRSIFSIILPLELLKTVKFGLEFWNFQLLSWRNPGTHKCVYMHMYTIVFQYLTRPPRPPKWGWWGVLKHWGCGVLEEHRVHQTESLNFSPLRKPGTIQREKLNGRNLLSLRFQLALVVMLKIPSHLVQQTGPEYPPRLNPW